MQKLESYEIRELEMAEAEAYMKGAVGLNELVGVTVAFIVIAIVAGFGVVMLSQMSSQVNDTTAQGVINNGTDAIKSLTGYLPLIALAIVIGIILTIVIVYLYRRFNSD